jgi:hypothetical protein
MWESFRYGPTTIEEFHKHKKSGCIQRRALRARIRPEVGVYMANDAYKKAFNELLESYLSLGVNAETIVRSLKKTANADIRGKLIGELRNLDKKRLEILDQIDNLEKST